MNENKRENRRKGNLGEDIAVAYLKNLGYEIMMRNYQKRYGEIDIIAEKGQYLYFVEVKARRDRAFGNPLESITPQKQQKICRVAQAYLQEHPSDKNISFLGIGIVFTKNGAPNIEMVEDNFLI